MPDPINGANRRPPVFNINELQGKAIEEGEKKVAETASSRIVLSTELRPGVYLPDMKITTRTIDDPEAKAKLIDVPADQLGQIDNAEAFKTLLTGLYDGQKDFLLPDKSKLWETLGENTQFAYNNISGKRIEQFFTEAEGLLQKTGLQGADLTAARKAVNLAHADAYRGRDIRFDQSDTSTYWSYGKDAAFVHVYEKMLDSLPEDHPSRKSLQNQLDHTFSKKYVYSGKMDENNAEKSAKLMAIDAGNRQVVSMNPDTMGNPNPTYDTIKLDASAGEHADKSVYWDHANDQYLFEGSHEAVPAELHDKMVRTPVDRVVLRRAKEGESPRDDFRFDWNSNNMVDHEAINTGWWGHCDIKAVMESIHADMKDSKGVKEYRSDSGKTTDYKRSDLLEIMSSQLNMGGGYVNHSTGKQVYLGENEFGGARFDKRPDKMYFNVNGQFRDFNVRIKSMSEVGEYEKAADVTKSFETFKTDDAMESFTANENIMQTIDGDTNVLSGNDRKIDATVEYYTVNENGQWVEKKEDISIDPSSDSTDKLLLGTQITDISNHRLQKFYLDPKTQEISVADVSFKRNDQGKFESTEGSTRTIGKSNQLVLTREMASGDDVEGKTRLFNESVRSGAAMATDSDKGQEVWNGAVYNLREEVEWRSEDGKYERIGVHVDAVFGAGKAGTKLNELDENGNVIKTHETNAPVDFFWRNVPRVAPLVHENGAWHINSGMSERGLLDLQNLNTSLDTMRNLNDLMYLGLKGDGQKIYTIVHDGKRLVYDNEAAWQADVDKLEAAANQ